MREVQVTNPTALAEAVARINAVHERVVRAGLEGVVEIGRIVLDVAYQGDEKHYRSRDPHKGVGLRRLADHPDLRLPGDGEHRAQALARAVGTYMTFVALPEATRPLLLEHHVEALATVKDPALRNHLAEMAARARPRKREFRRAVTAAREEAGERRKGTVRPGGQPKSYPTPAIGSAPVPLAAIPDWNAVAQGCLDQPAGRVALDALLAARGLHITPVTSAKKARKGKPVERSRTVLDVSGWAIRETTDRKVQLCVRTADLVAALAVLPFGGRRDPMSEHVLFRVENGLLELLSFKERTFGSVPVAADGQAVPIVAWTTEARRLFELLKRLKDETVVVGFNCDERVPFVKTGGSDVTFQSLDPAPFPYWDTAIREAKHTAKLGAARLASALTFCKRFMLDQEARQPALSLCEVLNGVLHSSNKQVVALVRVAGLETAAFRIWGQDVGQVTKFLGTCGDSKVELLEHDRILFVRRADGAIFGESRSHYTFPQIKIDVDEASEREWVVSREAFTRALVALDAVASREDNRVHVDVQDGKGTITVSIMSTTGTRATHEVPFAETKVSPDARPLPPGGFALDRDSLWNVLAAWKRDEFTFGVNVLAKRGFLRFVSERDGDKYVTIIAWLGDPPAPVKVKVQVTCLGCGGPVPEGTTYHDECNVAGEPK